MRPELITEIADILGTTTEAITWAIYNARKALLADLHGTAVYHEDDTVGAKASMLWRELKES